MPIARIVTQYTRSFLGDYRMAGRLAAARRQSALDRQMTVVPGDSRKLRSPSVTMLLRGYGGELAAITVYYPSRL